MGCLNLPKVIIGGGWRFSIEIRAALGYALAFWQGALALKHRRGASADAEMNLQLAGERIKSCGTIRAVCAACFTFFPFFLFFLFFFFFFFIRQSGIANTSSLLKDAGSRNTRRRCRTRRLKTFHSFELPARWIREKKREREEGSNRGKEKKREREREREEEACTLPLRVAWSRKWQMRTGRKRLSSRNAIACLASRKGNSLSLGLISEKNAVCKTRNAYELSRL